ncbi:hypothetical protein A3G14_02920 [Candidatus Curtissbacteria bacterium RIFCSPLOWO2_12_FULL_38_9]|uniref:PPM-type phosphatase domain-containing protein n=1 Tax=Candidatus Curtissbacteria bacterium RIFCSPLOWO2_12_FULL_38_9 TaxID=1797735 RepID=A0A1F5IAK2_9BACT|nr:MAG: hypothetical protein A2775_01305 [Candidatus Curtissbacteria bacterium RIFCSPHIGHO2_01_FULL_39_57]OGE13396.1 MAG: hypothetical protein A3G14_02920 [Candidatus Curtissbacteria bacterium RIFCSPLOWO2_12_FULL_38_9]
MEEINLQIEKITGQASERASCGVFSARVSFGDGTIGTLVSCILVKGAGSGDGATVVKDIFDLANKKLEGAQTGSLEALKQASESSREFTSSKNLDASFSLTLFYKNASYISRSGDKVKVWVFANSNSQELSFGHGSGHLKNGQIILIATEKFLSSFDISDILKEEGVNLEEIVDGLATEISAKDDQGEIGAALVLVKESESAEAGVAADDEKEEEISEETSTAVDDGEGTQELDTSHEIAPPDAAIVESHIAASDTEKSQPGALASLSKFKNPIFAPGIFVKNKITNINIASFKNRKTVVVLGAVALLILAGSALFSLKGGADREKINEFRGYLDSASAKYEEGFALIDLNREKARGIFIEADGEIKKALGIKPEDEEARALEAKIAAKLKETESLASVDFSTISEVNGSLVSLSKGDDSLVGVTESALYVIDVGGETTAEFDGKSGTRDSAVYDNNVFVFDGKSVWRIDLVGGAGEEIFGGHEAQDISVFLGNVYLLGSDQIYKYVPVEGGYAESANYLNEKEKFSTSSKFTIDGSIWVTNGSNVFKYLRGDKQDFTISGLLDAAGEFGEIYTDNNIDNVYVIDKTNSAMLVVGKDGVYKKAYQSADFGKASGLVVDEETGKFYIAGGNKVLVADL